MHVTTFPYLSQPPVRDWPEAWQVSGESLTGWPKSNPRESPLFLTRWKWKIKFSIFHIRICYCVPNPTHMFPERTPMFTGQKFWLLDLGVEISDFHPNWSHVSSLRGSLSGRLRHIIWALLALIWRLLSVYSICVLLCTESLLCRCSLSSAWSDREMDREF